MVTFKGHATTLILFVKVLDTSQASLEVHCQKIFLWPRALTGLRRRQRLVLPAWVAVTCPGSMEISVWSHPVLLVASLHSGESGTSKCPGLQKESTWSELAGHWTRSWSTGHIIFAGHWANDRLAVDEGRISLGSLRRTSQPRLDGMWWVLASTPGSLGLVMGAGLSQSSLHSGCSPLPLAELRLLIAF